MDANGKKNRGEMVISIWRWLAALRADSVDLTTGVESAGSKIDEMYTKDRVIEAINLAVTKYAVDVMVGDETVLAEERFLNVTANVVEYTLPEDLAFLKRCRWKDPADPHTVQPPNEYREMYATDNIAPEALDAFENGAPRFKRRQNRIVLDRTPDRDNAQGIMVEYIKWFHYLATDDQFLETQYARILQECVILSSAKNLSGITGGSVMAGLDMELKEVEARLGLACRAGMTPPYMQMIPATHPFMSRRGRRATR